MSVKYRCALHESHFLGFDTYLICLTGKHLAVPSSVKRILDNCRIADTLEGHADKLTRQLKLSEDKKPSLIQSLVEMSSKGLLLVPIKKSVFGSIRQSTGQNFRGAGIVCFADLRFRNESKSDFTIADE